MAQIISKRVKSRNPPISAAVDLCTNDCNAAEIEGDLGTVNVTIYMSYDHSSEYAHCI